MVSKTGSKPEPTKKKDDVQKETQPLIKETQSPPKETEVSKWLIENNAETFSNEFYRQGYYKVESVDDEAIKSIVKDKPGLANALKNSLAEWKKRKEASAMTPPKLPAGETFDLSAPELKTSDGITFSVPKTLSVDSTNAAIVSPNNIKPEEWSVIARSANLLYAYDMGGDEPKWAKTPILDWVVPARDDFARSEILHGKVTSALTYSDETASYVASGFDTKSATAAYTFCAASFERSHKEKTARISEKKTLIQVGMWKYPRAKIYMEKCTKPSERFVTAVKNALAVDLKDRFDELNKVFNEYGHVIPSAVLLGGQLCYKESRESTSLAEEHSEETKVKAAVEAKLWGASASAGAAWGSASEAKTGGINLNEFTSFTNQGGDSLLCTNPPAWAPTVKDPHNWAVIEMEEMRPTIDLLDPGLRQQVIDVWNSSRAILNPKELDDWEIGNWKNGVGKVYSENGGFVAAVRDCSKPSTRGWVQLISSGSKGDPKEDDIGTAAGATYTHRDVRFDRWIECNSICLPVPQGGSFRTRFGSDPKASPDARLIFVSSNLHFGQWQSLSDKSESWKEPKIMNEDGFLFVSIQAKNGERGGVKGMVKGWEIAGSYVQNREESKEWIEQQSFCMPVPGGTEFSITFERGQGSPNTDGPTVKTYWMPLDDTRWKMQETVPVTLNTQIPAETDGILHGWIQQTANGNRGMLKLYMGDDAVNVPPERLPCAAASMHYYNSHDHNCWVLYSSVMIPVAKGTPYKAVFSQTSGSPASQIWWTAIVPR